MRFSRSLMSTSRKWHNGVNFLPEDKEQDADHCVSCFCSLPTFIWPQLSLRKTLREEQKRLPSFEWLSGCVSRSRSHLSVPRTCFSYWEGYPRNIYRLLTDSLKIGCDTLNYTFWGETWQTRIYRNNDLFMYHLSNTWAVPRVLEEFEELCDTALEPTSDSKPRWTCSIIQVGVSIQVNSLGVKVLFLFLILWKVIQCHPLNYWLS